MVQAFLKGYKIPLLLSQLEAIWSGATPYSFHLEKTNNACTFAATIPAAKALRISTGLSLSEIRINGSIGAHISGVMTAQFGPRALGTCTG